MMSLLKARLMILTFHRASVTGAEHKIVVDVFITEQAFQLVNFSFSVHQHFSNRLGKGKTRRILVLVFGSFRTSAVWVLAIQGGNFLITPLSLRSSSAPRVTRCNSLLTKMLALPASMLVRRYIDTIPCQSEHLSHTQRAGERKVQGQQ